MREFTGPGTVVLDEHDHLVTTVSRHAAERPLHPYMAVRDGDGFRTITAEATWQRIRGLAKGLMADGLQPGDRFCIMAPTCLEWVLMDFAILAAGGVTVPIYDSSSADQVEWIISDSGAVGALFASARMRATAFDPVADALPQCRHVLTLDSGDLDSLTRRGEPVEDADLDARTAALTVSDPATIVYTSGTTGRPKGCVLTHGNLRYDTKAALLLFTDLVSEQDTQLLFLPLAHSFAKILQLIVMEAGGTTAFSTGPKQLVAEMGMWEPTFLASVPRIFEKIYGGIEQRATAAGGAKAKIFERAVDVSIAKAEAEADGSAPLGLRLQHGVFDRLVYGKIREAMGGRMKGAVSGGGPLGARLGNFFQGAGVPVYEGYGLTETSPVLTVNSPGYVRIGTVGRPIPGTTIRIAEDGEILAKGDQIFAGYWNNEAATRETFTEDGWFKTGDLGALDDEGFLRITGRKKEIIVTAGGKNVAPAVLEDGMRANPLVSQVMVVGDNRPFIAALVTIDEEAWPAWAEANGLAGRTVAEARDEPALVAEITAAMEDANKAVSKAEAIKKFVILPADWSEAGGELTPSLKIKRHVVAQAYAEDIEALYTR
jgi:long-chain acyl-CoA synthetase